MTNGPQQQGNWPAPSGIPPAGAPGGVRPQAPSWPAAEPGGYPPPQMQPAGRPGMPAGAGYGPPPDDINGPTAQIIPGQLHINQGGGAAVPRRRPRWIMPVALAAVVAVSAGITYAVAGRSGTDTPAPKAAGDTTYRVMPAKMLPNLDQVQQTTLLSLKPNGAVSIAVAPDPSIYPDICRLAASPIGQLAWGPAVSVASEGFTDNTATNFNASALIGLAVFSAPPAAADTFKKVSESARGCNGFTQPSTDPSTTEPTTWTVTDVHTSEGEVTWNATQKAPGTPWVCGKSYRLVGNLAAMASLCNQNPADTPSRLTDLVIAATTKQ
ncbi:hypothetical protein MTY66_61390 (plasmid) [Mycolicibacterium sp. TY66]|uniref:sensor domain-containing protein n=1 Tax=unclassified Mycolicibacterium TaxID=2636767 RepID=UPI001BB32513|nr:MULTISPECIES: sensor domain-containing protein [unclassified Mycolicibacterium]BCI84514.1 hypothetical protein MTY66_61390 [Mycolicibacterium sp. TY66]BCJ84745.1 hypothetical protein MTY81_61180 [Mycolicibacterium sp. TY81]